ncbi:ribosome small subunit-dependent GTPase A [Roseburia sp. OM04-10BH]|uniref:ribosome small subunit-dependent GTPase A n=1 Tax=unclassified Roseburia TaxID=2637578 RepID=UPI000E4B6CA3|nr:MULTISPECIES: ribosome small subunit-dependent GTPase A [unclassified Roseburia]RGI45622.1 ribosome small subunit-dependent GTPase A [Roseburia sp. OM04-10BH]RHV41077.1 ribosome small subunit-dependent GTPase A [Roseburia sp. OM04-15AA]
MQGKIVKGISGFYYVHVVESGIYECKAKGIFRQQKMKPLVGDDVEIDIISEEKKTGNVAAILPRKNALIRPAVANVDQALLIFAAASPNPNFNLLDRFLVMMGRQDVPVILCFNKCDLITEEQKQEIAAIYEASGCKILFVSAKKELGLKELQEILEGKTTTVAGPSGVGKSSLINLLAPEACMETGEISKKIERGRHTTRHAELIQLKGDGYIMDTPGFSSLYLPEMEKEELQDCYPEFAAFEPYCRFQGCSHISEPDCGVKEALSEGKIHPVRYENYCQLYGELKDRKKY